MSIRSSHRYPLPVCLLHELKVPSLQCEVSSVSVAYDQLLRRELVWLWFFVTSQVCGELVVWEPQINFLWDQTAFRWLTGLKSMTERRKASYPIPIASQLPYYVLPIMSLLHHLWVLLHNQLQCRMASWWFGDSVCVCECYCLVNHLPTCETWELYTEKCNSC